jgi:hypothetical protein
MKLLTYYILYSSSCLRVYTVCENQLTNFRVNPRNSIPNQRDPPGNNLSWPAQPIDLNELGIVDAYKY